MLLWAGVALAGMLHPLGAILLRSYPLIVFAILFVLFRVAAALAHAKLTRTPLALPHKRHFVLMGLVGCGIHLCEFAPLMLGVRAATNSVLVATVPLWAWVVALGSGKKGARSSLAPSLIVAAGAFLVVGMDSSPASSTGALLLALLAGLLISQWITMSSEARAMGLGAVQVSFWYDLMTLCWLALALVLSLAAGLTGGWTQRALDPLTLLFMLGYSVVVGYGANLALYWAAGRVSVITMGRATALEPVGSTLASAILLHQIPGLWFVLGAFMVVFGNMPDVERLWSHVKGGVGESRRLRERS
jgi:drug/metabolite transporter (DMT)-like permease